MFTFIIITVLVAVSASATTLAYISSQRLRHAETMRDEFITDTRTYIQRNLALGEALQNTKDELSKAIDAREMYRKWYNDKCAETKDATKDTLRKLAQLDPMSVATASAVTPKRSRRK